LLSRSNTTAVSYEEMVLSFPAWLEKVVGAFDLKDPAETRSVVAERHANSVAAQEKEDVWSHKRKVTPGDHREKLQSETIRELDRIFTPVLAKLGYSGEDYAKTGIPVVQP
ncbi:MAG: hypothetical protein ACMG5Z_07245, partial [Luteimonas sp.]